MKLGIVGKGGVGKTTTSSLLARAYTERGRRVLAVDTDSNPNLVLSLGLDLAAADNAPVIPRSLVVGNGDGRVTPAGLIADYGVSTPAGVTVLHAMRVTDAGDEEADVTLVDMEAGLEHLSRAGGTLAYADILLVVMEPTRKSILTAGRTLALAEELGIPRVFGLGNKARMPEDGEFFRTVAAEYGVELAGIIPYDPEVVEAERVGETLTSAQGQTARAAIDDVIEFVDAAYSERDSLLKERDRIDQRLNLLAAD